MAAGAAAAVVVGWGGQGEGVFTGPAWGLEAAGSRLGDLGSQGREARPLAALVGPRPPLSRLPSLRRARALGRSRGCSLGHLGDDEPTGGGHRAQGGIEPWAWGC